MKRRGVLSADEAGEESPSPSSAFLPGGVDRIHHNQRKAKAAKKRDKAGDLIRAKTMTSPTGKSPLRSGRERTHTEEREEPVGRLERHEVTGPL